MTERQWVAHIRAVAHVYGYEPYHTRDSRGSDEGWPDLCFGNVHTFDLVFIEAKDEKRAPTLAQLAWLELLDRAGLTVVLARPRHRRWVENRFAAGRRGEPGLAGDPPEDMRPWRQRPGWDGTPAQVTARLISQFAGARARTRRSGGRGRLAGDYQHTTRFSSRSFQ
jgi:hypothetical protein